MTDLESGLTGRIRGRVVDVAARRLRRRFPLRGASQPRSAGRRRRANLTRAPLWHASGSAEAGFSHPHHDNIQKQSLILPRAPSGLSSAGSPSFQGPTARSSSPSTTVLVRANSITPGVGIEHSGHTPSPRLAKERFYTYLRAEDDLDILRTSRRDFARGWVTVMCSPGEGGGEPYFHAAAEQSHLSSRRPAIEGRVPAEPNDRNFSSIRR
jgi:hypothetical protein